MKVSVIRGGGVAAISTRTELDAGALSPADARTLADKVQRAGLAREAPPVTGPPWPDQTIYELVVEGDQGPTTARFTEQNLPEAAADLIAWIDSRPERTQSLAR